MILLGSGLHFAFVLLGSWAPLALVAAVNESIWEHLKAGFLARLVLGLPDAASPPTYKKGRI